MTDDKRELNNGGDTVVSGFGANDSDGAYSSDPLHREEIVTEHLDELPDVENVEELIGDGHVYDEETAGALVALMFAKEHQEIDQFDSSEIDFFPREDARLGILDETVVPDRSGESIKKPNRFKLLLTGMLVTLAIALLLVYIFLPQIVFTSGDFSYFINHDLSATVSKYLGDESEVTIPESFGIFRVRRLGNLVFGNNTVVRSVYLPDGVISLGRHAFYECSSLVSVRLPGDLIDIGDAAFYNCVNLTDIEIPDTVTYIGDDAFGFCSNLVLLTIPDGVTYVGDGAFSDCSRLVYNEYDGAYYLGNYYNPYLVFVRPVDFFFEGELNTKTRFIHSNAFYGCLLKSEIVIPDSVIRIGMAAFCYQYDLYSVQISNSVTSIGAYAFDYCDNLTSIFIPESVTEIDYSAFARCSNLTIYCESKGRPDDWHADWNSSNCPVFWGCNSKEQ